MAKKNTLGMGSLPFAGTVSDSFDLVKRLWGVSGLPSLPTPAGMVQFAQNLPQALPSMIAPTLDVEEIDKRIADLRAVEQWLNLNVNMLRTTIQSLEVQRNTIATLRSFGGAMLTTLSKPGDAAAIPPAPAAAAPAAAAPAAATPTRHRTKPAQTPSAAAATGTIALNPGAWWNTLQEQFTKVAAAAAHSAAPAGKRAAVKPKRRKRAPASD